MNPQNFVTTLQTNYASTLSKITVETAFHEVNDNDLKDLLSILSAIKSQVTNWGSVPGFTNFSHLLLANINKYLNENNAKNTLSDEALSECIQNVRTKKLNLNEKISLSDTPDTFSSVCSTPPNCNDSFCIFPTSPLSDDDSLSSTNSTPNNSPLNSPKKVNKGESHVSVVLNNNKVQKILFPADETVAPVKISEPKQSLPINTGKLSHEKNNSTFFEKAALFLSSVITLGLAYLFVKFVFQKHNPSKYQSFPVYPEKSEMTDLKAADWLSFKI